MADRVDFYFRQRVTEAELDLAFGLLEQADRDLAADIGIYGIVTGAVPHPAQPGAGPQCRPHLADARLRPARAARAHRHRPDRRLLRRSRRHPYGGREPRQRALAGGVPPVRAAALGPSHGRQRAAGLLPARRVLRARRPPEAPEGPVGTATRVAMQPDELLVCDIRLAHGQTQLLNTHINLARRQAFIFAQGVGASAVLPRLDRRVVCQHTRHPGGVGK